MKEFVKCVCLVACMNLVSAFACSHGNLIKGTVSDAETGELLTGASVLLASQHDAIRRTDILGNFYFDNLADGRYTVRITFIGYLPYTVVVELANNETRVLRIDLSPSPLRLEEVTITQSSEPDQVMSTISKIDIALRPLKSAQDVLRMIPGLVTAQHAGGGKAEQIFLRGFDIDHGTDIALTVDGMPVNMPSHAHGQGYADLHFLIPEIIDHVDFDKGPYYASVGDFNTAGYADFKTMTSLDNSSVKFEAGRFDTWRTVALLDLSGSESGNQHAYAAAEYHFTNGPFISPQNFNRVNLFGKYHALIGDDKIVDISLSAFKSKWDASGQIPERAIKNGVISRFGAVDDTEGGITERVNANMSVTKVFDQGASFKNQIYFSHYDFDLYSNFTLFLHDPINGDAIRQKENREIYGYAGTFNKEYSAFGRQIHTESGIGIRYDDVSGSELSRVKARYSFIKPITLGDIDQITASIYTQASINITPNLSITAGMRLDVFSFQYADRLDSLYYLQAAADLVASPKLNVHYTFGPNLQLYLKNGIGFHSNDARVVVARNAIETLPKAYGTDVGLFAKPLRNLLLNVAAWQLRLEQEFVYVGDEAVVEPSGETQRYGVDVSVRYQVTDWLFADFDANYAYGRSLGELEGENFIPLAPAFTSIGGLSASWQNGLKAMIRYRHIADRPANEVYSVEAKGYFLLDAGITYARKNVQFSINATNLLNVEWNEAQFDTETRLAGEAVGISELTFTPGDPFFIKGGITFSF